MTSNIWTVFGVIGVIVGIISIIYSITYIKIQHLKLEKILSISAEDLKLEKYCIDETLDAKLHQSINELYRNLNIEYKQADSEKEAVKAYIADLSHQMKTPLANLKLYSDLLIEEELTGDERRECENKIRAELNKIEWQLMALTKITRLETGAINFQVKNRLLNETIEKSINSVEGLAKERGINIVLEPLKEDIYVLHNLKWTQEAIVNILENAIKYSKEFMNIVISIEVLELYIRINISDCGSGIEKKDYNNIFKRFYRGNNVSDNQGSGLGLYLSQLIMNKQEGYITVKSEINEGSIFSVYMKKQVYCL